MTSDELITRARQRCSRCLPASGMCRDCFRAELEDMPLEENPDLGRGDAHLLVLEWVRRVGEPEH